MFSGKSVWKEWFVCSAPSAISCQTNPELEELAAVTFSPSSEPLRICEKIYIFFSFFLKSQAQRHLSAPQPLCSLLANVRRDQQTRCWPLRCSADESVLASQRAEQDVSCRSAGNVSAGGVISTAWTCLLTQNLKRDVIFDWLPWFLAFGWERLQNTGRLERVQAAAEVICMCL